MSKKRVPMIYMEYEGEALRGYLEEMALKGWRLNKVGNLFLTFESVEPHPIRYDVELMEGSSAYDSVMTPDQKNYRDFCREEGWEYAGTNGLLHIFRTENMEALPVETDERSRYDRIVKGNAGNKKMLAVVFGLIVLLNLWACYLRGSVWNSNGFCAVIILGFAAYYMVNIGVWRRQAGISLEQTGRLPEQDWKKVRRKNRLALGTVFLLCLPVVCHQIIRAGGNGYMIRALAVYLIFYAFLMFLFTRLIGWLREKKSFSRGTNIAIYWGTAVLAIVVGAAVSLFLIMSLG